MWLTQNKYKLKYPWKKRYNYKTNRKIKMLATNRRNKKIQVATLASGPGSSK